MALYDNLKKEYEKVKTLPTPEARYGDDTVSKLMESTFQTSREAPAANALIGEGTRQANFQEQRAKEARAQRLSELQEIANKIEKGSYKRVPTRLGFEFRDPLGNKTSAWEYARNRGVGIQDALQGSLNVKDQQFLSDYQTIKDVTRLLSIPEDQREDDEQKYVEDFLTSYPEYQGDVSQEVLEDFMINYKEYFYQQQGE